MEKREIFGIILRVTNTLLLLALFAFPLYPLKVTNVLFILFCIFTLINYARDPFPVGKLFLMNLVFVIPFIPYLIELFLSGFDPVARFEFEKKMLFFIAPFIISIFIRQSKTGTYLPYALYFAVSVTVLSIYTMAVMLIQRIPFSFGAYENGAYIFRSNFERISGLHPTYYSLFAVFSLFSVIAILTSIRRFRYPCIVSGIILFIMLFFIAVKTAIITAFICTFILIFKFVPELPKRVFLIILIPAVFLFMAYRIPSMKNRFDEVRTWIGGSTTTDNTIAQRLDIFNCSVKVFSDNLWIGTGSRNFQQQLNARYVADGHALLKEKNYNPHNQFLSMGIDYGIFALLAFLICLFIIFRRITGEIEGVFFTVAIILFFLSESLLERQMGVYFFGLIGTLFYNISLQEETKN